MRGVHITLRMRLFCEVFRDGKPMEGQQYEVLNEVVVDRGANPYLTKIECYEQGKLITKVSCCIAVDLPSTISAHLPQPTFHHMSPQHSVQVLPLLLWYASTVSIT